MSRSRTPFNGAPTFDCRVAKLAAYERFRSLDEFGTLRRLTMTPIFTVLATEQAVCITDIDRRGSRVVSRRNYLGGPDRDHNIISTAANCK